MTAKGVLRGIRDVVFVVAATWVYLWLLDITISAIKVFGQ